MKLKQLQYIGEKVNGISLQLYKSYKTITISSLRPIYELTDKDDNSQAAINYYKLNFPSSVKCITENDDTPKVNTKVTKEVTEDSDKDTKEDELNKEDKSNKDITEDTSSEINELSDEELKSKLESVDRSTIKEALENADPELKLGRKSKGTIIDETIEKYRDVLESLTN